MALSSPGIGSNLDINGIISQLMSIEQQPLAAMARKEASYQSKLSAVGNVKSALSTFQTAVKSLSDMSKYQAVKVTPADASIATATGTSGAVPGTYSLDISKLAQAQKLVSAGQASTSAEIGTGTITFDFGTIKLGAGSFDSATGKYTGASFESGGTGTKTITIDSTNNSLSGIRDAINSAKMGVTASIINDGDPTAPYRLVLTESNTGKAHSMKLSVSGAPELGTLLNHDPAGVQGFSETVTAQNAEFKVDGISITKTTNAVTDVIPGVTLNLGKAPGTTNVTVARDTTAVTGAVGQFVFAYNQINQTLRDVSSYNSTTKQAAALNGDATVRAIQSQIRGVLSTPIAGGAGTFSVLSQVGVSLQKDGTLAVDNAKLQSAIDSNFGDIAGVFAAMGKATDSLVSYTGSSDKTKPGAYALNVTKIATQGSFTASAAAGLTIDPSNDTLQVKLDGVTATIKLNQTTYADANALVSEIQSKINGASEFVAAGSTVKVTQTGGKLSIVSSRYGSASGVVITGIGKDNLTGGVAANEQSGEDVAGTLNGAAATGSGQFLTGTAGTDAEGLKLQILGSATGSRGEVKYSRGYAYQFDKLIESLLNSEGPLSAKTDGLNASIKSLSQQKERLNDRLVDIEKRYRAQFTALDKVLSGMTNTSNFLSQQLANLPKIE